MWRTQPHTAQSGGSPGTRDTGKLSGSRSLVPARRSGAAMMDGSPARTALRRMFPAETRSGDGKTSPRCLLRSNTGLLELCER